MPETLPVPPGYDGVEWADGTVHAVSLTARVTGARTWEDGTLWRAPVACGRAGPGVSSDEYGPRALHRTHITCWECVSILA
jgi:hypothetical protein